MMSRALFTAAIAFMLTHSATALACAACYGKSDAPMARGMNAGIFVLLGVVAVVLSGVAGFFVYLAKKPVLPPGDPASGTTSQNSERD